VVRDDERYPAGRSNGGRDLPTSNEWTMQVDDVGMSQNGSHASRQGGIPKPEPGLEAVNGHPRYRVEDLAGRRRRQHMNRMTSLGHQARVVMRDCSRSSEIGWKGRRDDRQRQPSRGMGVAWTRLVWLGESILWPK
jgi:hypothetical protein